jgi:hypothetical protein
MYVSVLAERFNGQVKNKAAKRNMIASDCQAKAATRAISTGCESI